MYVALIDEVFGHMAWTKKIMATPYTVCNVSK